MNSNFWKKILIILLLAGVVYLTYRLGGRILSKVAVNQISKLTDTDVTAESVEFGLDGSVTLKGLVLRPEGKFDYDNTILKADRVFVKFSRLSFLIFNPKLKKLDADGLDFNILYNVESERWNISRIKLKLSTGDGDFDPPAVNLENAQVQFGIVNEGTIRRITQTPVEAAFTPSEEEGSFYDFQIKTAKREGIAGKSELNGVWKEGRVWVTGSMSSEDLPDIEVNWSIYTLSGQLEYEDNGDYRFDLSIKDFVSEHKLERISLVEDQDEVLEKFEALAGSQKFFNRYRPSGRIDIQLRTAGNLHNLKESEVSGTVLCKDVNIYDRKFPYEIRRLHGKIEFTRNSVSLVNLKGKHGETELRISGKVENFGEDKTFDIHLRSDNMKLNKDLEKAIPDKFREQWDKFELEGTVRVHFHSQRETGSEKKEKLQVYPVGINIIYKPFPYPLKQVHGEMIFEDDKAEINNIISEYEGRKITVNGRVNREESTQSLNIECENLPVDEQLKSVLQQTDFELPENLELLSGRVDAEIKIKKTEETEERDHSVKVHLKDAALKTEFLPEEITNVNSVIAFEHGTIDIRRFTGKALGGQLSLSGNYTTPEGNYPAEYDLIIEGKNTDLQTIPAEQLEAFVGKTDIFDKARLKGTANYRLEVSRKQSETRPDYNLTLDFTGASAEFTNIPYSLNNLTGRITAVNGQITFSDIEANPTGGVRITDRESTVSLNGTLDLRKDQPLQGRLSVRAEDIPLDENIKSILNEKAQAAYEKLAPTGRFDLNFPDCNLVREDGNYTVELNGQVNLKNFTSPMLNQIENVNLEFHTDCIYKTTDGIRINDSEIRNGSLSIKGKTVKNISADLLFDMDENEFSIDKLRGDLYGGKVAGSLQGRFRENSDPEYNCKLYINNASLEKFLSEDKNDITEDKKYRSGTIGGNIQLSGSGSSAGAAGNIDILIKNIKAGKVSLPGKILRIIRRKPASQYAFDRATIRAYLRNDSLFVEKISLIGEGSNLEGSGVINVSSNQMYLTFAIKRGDSQTIRPDIIDSLAEALGPAVVRIEVTGSIYEPKVTTTTLPVLRDTINILGKPRQ